MIVSFNVILKGKDDNEKYIKVKNSDEDLEKLFILKKTATEIKALTAVERVSTFKIEAVTIDNISGEEMAKLNFDDSADMSFFYGLVGGSELILTTSIEQVKIDSFNIHDVSADSMTNVSAKLMATLDNIYDTKDGINKSLKDILLGCYQNNKQVGYYPFDIENTSIFNEWSYFEQDIARRLFGIYIPGENPEDQDQDIQIYVGSFLDNPAIKVEEKAKKDENGNWYYPPLLSDSGELQYEEISAIEKWYKTPGFQMKNFAKTESDPPIWYPVKVEEESAVSTDFAEYLYNSLNSSSFVQDLLMYARFWDTIAAENWTDLTTQTVMSQNEIQSLFPEWAR